jgi:CheY-like chemotaxis protein
MTETAAAKKVLVADPSGESRRSLCGLLREKGLEVIETSDGSKALSEALLHHPDLLLLDLSAGLLSPERLVRILRTNPNTMGIPILFLSDKEQGVPGFLPGVDEFLRRPFHEEEILLRIQRILFPDLVPGGRGFPRFGAFESLPAKCEFLPPEDIARLRSRMEERGPFGDGKVGRIVLFLPDPFFLEGVVTALGRFREFEADGAFFALRRKDGFPIGKFGKIRVGEENSLLLYAFPYLQSVSPVWYAIAPRPVGIVAFLKDEVSSSLEGLLAVSDYTRGADARAVLAVMGKTFTNFGLGKNTLRLFQNRVEKLGCSLKVQEMEQLSPEEIREAMECVVRQFLEGEGI